MLVAYRLAGLSALETYYARVRVGAQFGAARIHPGGSFLAATPASPFSSSPASGRQRNAGPLSRCTLGRHSAKLQCCSTAMKLRYRGRNAGVVVDVAEKAPGWLRAAAHDLIPLMRFHSLSSAAQDRSDWTLGGEGASTCLSTCAQATIADVQALENTGRSERIRTSDPIVPNDVRYQAALHSDMAAPSDQRGYIRATVVAQASPGGAGSYSRAKRGPLD